MLIAFGEKSGLELKRECRILATSASKQQLQRRDRHHSPSRMGSRDSACKGEEEKKALWPAKKTVATFCRKKGGGLGKSDPLNKEGKNQASPPGERDCLRQTLSRKRLPSYEKSDVAALIKRGPSVVCFLGRGGVDGFPNRDEKKKGQRDLWGWERRENSLKKIVLAQKKKRQEQTDHEKKKKRLLI